MEKLNTRDFRFFIGSQCLIKGTKCEYISIIEGIDLPVNKVITSHGYQEPSKVKPILRKFENLSRHEVEGLNKLWPIERISRTTFDSIKLDAGIIDYLTSLNVDVFGWIERDLATDAANNNKI